MHYGAARSFERSGALSALVTDICGVKGLSTLLHAVPPPVRPASLKRLLGRVPLGIPPAKIVSFSWLGLEYYLRISRCKTEADRLRTYLRINRKFCNQVAKTGFGGATHVYTFAPAALEILQAARAAGVHTVVEQPIAASEIERKIMEEERRRFPGWEPSRPHEEEARVYAERERAEWEIADTIIVPSNFVARSLEDVGISADRCAIVPYGVSDEFRQIVRHHHKGPLRILSVGGVQLRKGSQYTVKAARILGNSFEFRLVEEAEFQS